MKSVTPLLLGVFFALAALICLGAGVTMLSPDTGGLWILDMHAREDMLLLRPASTAGFFVLALATAGAAYGCFTRKRWGRTLAVSILALSALSNTVRVVQSSSIDGAIGVVIAGLIILWITRAHVKALFV